MDKRIFIYTWVFVLILVGLSCATLTGESAATATAAPTLPKSIESEEEMAATPNLTLTAVFSAAEESEEQTKPTSTSRSSVVATSIVGGIVSTATARVTPEATSTSTLAPVATELGVLLDFDITPTLVTTEKRPGPSLIAQYQETVPVIDADPADWTAPLYLADQVVAGEGFRVSAQDISADFKIGWDQSNLYLAAVVRDSKFVQNSEESQLWRGDSLEIMLDTNVSGDYDDHQISGDDFHIGFSPGQLNLKKSSRNPIEVFIWEPQTEYGLTEDIDIAFRLTDDGYLMEAAIPWDLLDTAPISGQHFGFFFSVTDNDDVNFDRQQTIVSFIKERVPFNPTTWKDLVLQ